MMTTRRFAPVACALVLAAAPLAAQTTTPSAAAKPEPAVFLGSLLDTVGRALPNAQIVLTDARTGRRHDGRTDPRGHFRFELPAGEYHVDAPMPGFLTRHRVMLRSGQTVEGTVTLQIGTVQQGISAVREPRAQLERRQVDAPRYRAGRCSEPTASGCLEPPILVNGSAPYHPQHRLATSAIVIVEGRIGTDGFVHALQLSGPADSDLAAAALEAVGNWQFTPTRLNGIPVESGLRATITYRVE